MHFKMSSEKWRRFCPGGDELNYISERGPWEASPMIIDRTLTVQIWIWIICGVKSLKYTMFKDL